jgi:hypothetical protein
VRATVTAADGAAREAYQGGGGFSVDDSPDATRPHYFRVHSEGVSERGRRSLLLWRAQGARAAPAPGTYAVMVPGRPLAAWPGLAATYTTTVDGWFEAYVGTAGTVTVTESSPERMAGTFRFTAARYYRGPLQGTGTESELVRGRPEAPPVGQPSLQVTGTFSVPVERRSAGEAESRGRP